VALPPKPFDTDRVVYRRVSQDCVIRVDTNDYSVSWRTAQRYQQERIPVRLDGEWVRIWDGGHEVVRHPRCYGRHQLIIDRTHYEGLTTSRAATAFAALEQGFLAAYGEVGQHFYTGLGRKMERLQAALAAVLRLEQCSPHADIVAALEVAVAQASSMRPSSSTC
jgi:hypothetical protein